MLLKSYRPLLPLFRKSPRQKEIRARAVLLQEALETRKKVSGPTHPNVALTLADIGEFQLSMKRYDTAIETFERALRMVEDALGPGSYLQCLHPFPVRRSQTSARPLREALAAYERTIQILVNDLWPGTSPPVGIFTGAPRFPVES